MTLHHSEPARDPRSRAATLLLPARSRCARHAPARTAPPEHISRLPRTCPRPAARLPQHVAASVGRLWCPLHGSAKHAPHWRCGGGAAPRRPPPGGDVPAAAGRALAPPPRPRPGQPPPPPPHPPPATHTITPHARCRPRRG